MITSPVTFDENKLQLNRPWWPSGLERVSNSSRCSLKDPGLNPARGMIIYMDEFTLHTEFSTNKHAKVPHHGFLAQRLMAGSELLIQEADPHITKLAIGARM